MDDTTHSEGRTDPPAGEATSSPPPGSSNPAPAADRLSAPLRRPTEGRMVGGVCAGMAEAWRVDPLPLRIAFVAATLLLFPVGPPLYLACWILMPPEHDVEPTRTAAPGPGTVEPLVTDRSAQ